MMTNGDEIRMLSYELGELISLLRGPRNHNRRRDRANQYGGKGLIKYNPSTSEIQSGILQQTTLVDWESEDKMAHEMTIECGRINSTGTYPSGTNPAGVNLSYRATAEILVSSPGTTQEAFYIDLDQKLVIAASRVSITIQAVTPPAGSVGGVVGVYGTIGEGTAPTLAPLLKTRYVDALPVLGHGPTGIPQTVVIPDRSNFLLPVTTSDPNAGNIGFTVLDNANNVIGGLPAFASGGMVAPFPIAEDAYSLAFVNLGTVPINSRLIFQLAV